MTARPERVPAEEVRQRMLDAGRQLANEAGAALTSGPAPAPVQVRADHSHADGVPEQRALPGRGTAPGSLTPVA